MTDQQDSQSEFPNASRIYDYTLGGHHNYEADRQAAEYMFSLVPSTKKWVHILRQFIREGAHQMESLGFDKFIDLGSGLPTADHLHSLVPNSKVIYVDNDPVTVTFGTELLEDNPNARYIQEDARNVEAILASPVVKELFGDDRKVAFVVNAVTSFFSMEENIKLMQDLYDWAAPGSRIFVTFESKNPDMTTPKMEQFLAMFDQMGAHFEFITLEQSKEIMGPWVVDENGYKPIAEWLGVGDMFTEEDHEGVELEFYAAILEKK